MSFSNPYPSTLMSRCGHKELSQATRGYILALRDEGLTYPEIAERLSISPSTAYKTVNRALVYGTTYSRPRSGRPPKYSACMCRFVIRKLRTHRTQPFSTVSKLVSNDLSPRQIRYIANTNGYHRFVACPKPHIDRIKAIKHLKWACTNRFRNWHSIMWTK